MNRNGSVIIIEDDADDQELLVEVFKKLNYPNGSLLYNYKACFICRQKQNEKSRITGLYNMIFFRYNQ